jgi:high-affinity K+ transport system ATPase subunit B
LPYPTKLRGAFGLNRDHCTDFHVDTLLLDKTGTITLGNRQATEFVPLSGLGQRDLADAAQLVSLSDETPEGRSIVVLAKEKYGIRARELTAIHANFIPFSAQTRISGVDSEGISIRKGAVDAVLAWVGQSAEGASELTTTAERSYDPQSLQRWHGRQCQSGARSTTSKSGISDSFWTRLDNQ